MTLSPGIRQSFKISSTDAPQVAKRFVKPNNDKFFKSDLAELTIENKFNEFTFINGTRGGRGESEANAQEKGIEQQREREREKVHKKALKV